MKKLLAEFKAFAFKGNVVELAVAVILGLAFNTVVQSSTNDVLMNVVAGIFGQPEFSALSFGLGDATVHYGAFLNTVVNFLLVAAVLFFVIKAINKALRPRGAPEEAPSTRECPYCKSVIPITATRCGACTSEVEPLAPR